MVVSSHWTGLTQTISL